MEAFSLPSCRRPTVVTHPLADQAAAAIEIAAPTAAACVAAASLAAASTSV